MEKGTDAEFEFLPGDIIVPMSGAFVKLLEPKSKGKFCDHCFQSGELRRCGGCQLMHYCKKKCQIRDWKQGHQLECKSETFKIADRMRGTGAPNQSFWIRVILRFVAKFHLHPNSFSENHPGYDGTPRSFNDMTSHDDPILNDLQHIRDLFQTIRFDDTSYRAVDFGVEFLSRVVGVWKANMLEISDVDLTQKIGAGLFIPQSALDHSCRPNAYMSQGQPGKFEIRCIHPIKKGERPLISYLTGKLALNLEMRQAKLQRKWHFTCACEVCTAEQSGPLIDYSHDALTAKEVYTFPSLRAATGFREEWLELLRKLYHEYDQRITTVSTILFYSFCQMPVTKDFIWEEAIDLEKRLQITYGKDSSRYLKFQEIVNDLGIKID